MKSDKWSPLKAYPMKNNGPNYLIELQDGRCFIVNNFSPRYGFYNFLFPVNTRVLKEVSPVLVDKLRQEKPTSISGIAVIGLAIIIALGYFTDLNVMLENAFSYFFGIWGAILVGIILSFAIIRLSELYQAHKIPMINKFPNTHRIKIKTNTFMVNILLMVFCYGFTYIAFIPIPYMYWIFMFPLFGTLFYGPFPKLTFKRVRQSYNYMAYTKNAGETENIDPDEENSSLCKDLERIS
ncbi:hypothetical protein [Companilactobacillus mishanensis]|uniref:hypothetical protein n=1 Tax=Companilactobacillus mishanensis TaxID=2486008 RepID=UPI001295F527|nr:hypothetical protein [Companilactobacillus mishanensis]MQS88927.1 hypothetical protein [Companilactobacillus mishanensis]